MLLMKLRRIDFLEVSAVLIARAEPYVDMENTMESRDIDVMDVIVPLRILLIHLVIIVKSL